MRIPQADSLHAALSVALAWAVAAWFRSLEKVQAAVQGREKAEKALRQLQERPETAEFRIERFDLLWYPVVTASVQNMEIASVVVGVPHCGKCAVPLGLDKKEWVCARCEARHPESLTDAMVLDTVEQQAIKYFQERRPGYRVALKRPKP